MTVRRHRRGTQSTIALLALTLVAAPILSAVPAQAKMLEGGELRRVIAGKRVYLATPLGGEFPLFYRPDGRVDGSGEAVGLGRFLKPKDSGRWWVDGRNLCQQWQSWYDGRVFCFTVSQQGANQIAWVRDDGEKGIARLAD